eukprot:3586312-Rhodomonas_salina.3
MHAPSSTNIAQHHDNPACWSLARHGGRAYTTADWCWVCTDKQRRGRRHMKHTASAPWTVWGSMGAV